MMMMSRVVIPICKVKSLCLISATYSMLKRQFLHDYHHYHTYILNSHDNNINISYNNHYYNRHRLYHCSIISLGPKNKKSNNNDNNTGSTITLPDVKDIKLKMEIYIDKFSKELSTLKIGIVSIDIFNNINVSSYGTISNLGQVTIKSATNININVFDPSTTKLICDAIKDAGLGLNPTIEGSNITVFIPKPSKDSRELMKKSASKMAEKWKQDIRNVRKDALDKVKKCKGEISEDEMKRCSKEVESMTEKHAEKISQLLISKEKEIMNA